MPRILIVDDEPSIGTLYKEEFEDEGYEVKIAASGQEALAAIDCFQPAPCMCFCAADFGSWACDAYVVKSSDLAELKQAVGRALKGSAA